MSVPFNGIYGIVDAASTTNPLALLDAMLAGGIRVVQYRAKAGVDRALVRALHGKTQVANAYLIVNDDFDAALEADGWHAGQEDLAARNVRALRKVLGARIFGVSCDTAELALAAAANGADYVGVGPFASTATKADAGAPIGVDRIAVVVRATALPVVAIGGIDANNLPDVRRSGAAMAAVVSAIALAPDPLLATQDLVRRWNACRPA